MVLARLSFQERLFLVTGLFLLLIAGTALYTKLNINQLVKSNHESQLEFHKHKMVQNQLFWGLIEFEGSLHRYTLDPTPQKGDWLNRQLKTLSLHVNDLQRHVNNTKHDQAIALLVAQAVTDAKKVENSVNHLVSHLNVPEKRFPAMKYMVNALFPLREEINLALNLALQEEPTRETTFQQLKIRELFFQLRYHWYKQLGLARLFISNRSSVFEAPQKSMQRNLFQRNEHIKKIQHLLAQLQLLNQQGVIDITQSESLDIMARKFPLFNEAFDKTSAIYLSEQWRMDLPLLTTHVNPALVDFWKTMRRIESHLDEEFRSQQQNSVILAENINNLLWFFFSLALLFSIFLYLFFIKGILQPIKNVTTALDLVARGKDEINIPAANAPETEVLIKAFDNMKEQVKSRQHRLQSILNHTHDGIITIDEKGKIETFNRAAEKLFGYHADEILGENVKCLMPDPDRSQHDEYIKQYCISGQSKILGKEFERMAVRKDGTQFPISIKTNEMLVEGKRLFTGVTADISERREMIDRLKHMAERDSLTGLYNRRYFLEELNRTLQRMKRGSKPGALLFLDLDNFKYVNDTMGHPAGDQVLLDITDILKQRTRAGDLLARQGGDEFAALLYEIDEKVAVNIAEDYRKKIAHYQFSFEGKSADVGCSIGIALINNESPDSSSLLAQADIACHLAKKGGRNQVYLYQDKDYASIENQSIEMSWASLIQKAIVNQQFKIHLTPILDLKAEVNQKSRYQVEAIIIDEHGQEFRKLEYQKHAQRFNLLKEIDNWLLENAIELLVKKHRINENIRFNIPVSYQAASANGFLKMLEDLLRKHNLSPNSLIIEFRENEVVHCLSQIRSLTEALNNLGCMVSVAGIGVGSMQFAYLQHLPVELIRIDKSLVDNLEKDNVTKVLVKSIIDIGHILYKNVGAEGVDSTSAANTLIDMDADCIQGRAVTERI